jgi:hypothetical protein
MIPIRMPDQRTVVSARVRRHAVVARGARSPARGTAATNSMTASTCRVAPDSAAEHASRGTEVLPPIDALGQGRRSRATSAESPVLLRLPTYRGVAADRRVGPG